MMRLLLGAGALALLLGGCDDGDAAGGGSTPGRDNGERCLTATANNPCRGGLCLPFVDGGDVGVCGEPCTEACRFGGICVRYAVPGGAFERVCLAACVSADECGEGLACLLLSEAFECSEGGCADDPSDQAWCQPPF